MLKGKINPWQKKGRFGQKRKGFAGRAKTEDRQEASTKESCPLAKTH